MIHKYKTKQNQPFNTLRFKSLIKAYHCVLFYRGGEPNTLENKC